MVETIGSARGAGAVGATAETRCPLTPMFKKLVKLQKLSINYTPIETGTGRRIDWMSSYGRKILLPLLHLLTLTSISLFAIRNFALADLAGCVNLKELWIGLFECSTGDGQFLEALPGTPAMLERLEIDNGNVGPVQRLFHARRPDGKPIIDFSLLKKIVATVERLDLMREIFGMCANLHKIELSSMSLLHLISSSI